VVVGPADEAQSEGPAADSGKEVVLGEAIQILRFHIGDAPSVHLACGQQAVLDQRLDPVGRRRVKFVVIGRHCFTQERKQ